MFAADINFTVFDFYFLAGEGDDALDEVAVEAGGAAGGGRGGEDNDVAAFRLTEFVGEFVGEEKFAVVEVGIHGVAVDLVGLGDQQINQNRHRGG